MVSQTTHAISKSEPNRHPAAGGKSLKSFPIPPRSALDDSGEGEDGADDEDVGLTVSEGDDADSDNDNDNENDSDSDSDSDNDNGNDNDSDKNADARSAGNDDAEDDEDARIKTLAEDGGGPDLLSLLGKDSDSEGHPSNSNSNAIATTSEEEDDDDEDEENDNDDDDNALDDSSIEEEEEAAIKAELSRKNRRRSIPGPVSLRRLSQSQPTRRQSQENSEDSDNESDDSSSSSSSSSWGNEYLEDYFDQPVNPSKQTPLNRKGGYFAENSGDDDDSQSDDESHLWQYFFSSEEGDDGFGSQFDGDNSRAQSSKRANTKPRPFTAPKDGDAERGDDGGEASTDDDMPLKGRGPLPLPANANPSGYIPSGDSTDEDDGVPPERKRRRARGTKAIEVLGSNSFSTRPPVLGSWHIKGDKNVGIIDGLTTRTLSPPPAVHHQDPLSHYDGSPRNHGTPIRGGEPVDPFENLGDTPQDSVTGIFADFADSSFDFGAASGHNENGADEHAIFDDIEVSDLDLLELGDYINTNGMSSDENDGNLGDNLDFELDFEQDPQQQHQQQQQQQQPRQFRSPVVSPYIYRSRFPSRTVPISAFRNRGSPYVHNPAYPSDNPSPAPRRARGSSVSGRRPSVPRDAFMSPSARQARKRVKKVKSGPGPRSALAGHHAPSSSNGHPSFEDGTHDLLGELIEIGAISPLFDVNQ